ncbi:MAG: NAD(P)H-hydrate dehydratase [Planctomycetota bacterium]
MSAPGQLPRRADDLHKGRAGRVLFAAGSRDMPGAALLIARAAQRAGAGLVVLARTHHSLAAIVAGGAPESVQVDFEDAVDWTAREPHARLAGPGLGATAKTRALVESALACDDDVPLVLDADALGVFTDEAAALGGGRAPRILTPHPGEAAKLLGRAIGSSAAERLAAARELAERSASIVCLKGAGTIVATPAGSSWTSDLGNPGLATAGTGDVLAGTLVAFVASAKAGGWEHSLEELARLAVWAHGRAGDLAAAAIGERGLIASDVIDFLPAAQLELTS